MRERCRSSEAAHAKVYVRSDEQTRLIRAQMPGALQSCTGAFRGVRAGLDALGQLLRWMKRREDRVGEEGVI